MSTDPLPPPERVGGPGGPGGLGPGVLAAIGTVAGLLLVAVVALVLTSRDGGDVAVDQPLTATPVASATVPPATPTPTPTPSPSATASATPTPTPTGPREPTDTDAASYAASVTPPGAEDPRTLLADLEGDGRDDVVLVLRLGGTTLLQVGRWDGEAYQTVLRSEGGSADELVDVAVRDITRTPATREIVVRQRSGDDGESVSLWGVLGGSVGPLEAIGGCWAGSHTYGIVGVTVDPQEGELVATCDGSPAPIASWPSDVYGWRADVEAFVYVETRGGSEPTPTPTPTPTLVPPDLVPVPTAEPD